MTTAIPQTILGQTGLQVGRLGLGTWELGSQNIDVSTTRRILKLMLRHGGNLIDTSDNYDGAEKLLGTALKSFNRDDFVLVTKCGDYADRTFDSKTGLSTNDPKYKYAHLNFTPEVIRRNVEDSLRNLRVDHLDVLLIHTCFMPDLVKGEAIDAIIRVQEEGKVRFIGYSGDNCEATYTAQIPEFSVMELSLNMTDMRNVNVPLSITKENGLGTIIKRPIANAFWRKDIYQVAAVYANDYRNRAKLMGLHPSRFGLQDSNAGWMKMALAFTLSFPVDCLIIGTTRLDHMQQNINLVSQLHDINTAYLVEGIMTEFCRAQNRIQNYADNKIWLGLE